MQSLSSYRILATILERQLGSPVGRSTLNRWVDRLGAAAMTPLQLSKALRPSWSGVLGIDGKVVWAGGQRMSLLVAVDQGTQDLVHALLVPFELPETFTQLVTEAVRDGGYPLRGIVSDMRAGFWTAWKDYFGRVPYQACRVHFDRRIGYEIPRGGKARKGPNALIGAEYRARLRAIIYADTKDEARELLHNLQRDAADYRGLGRANFIKSLSRFFFLYMTFHDHPELPADNNITENVIKQLGKKLRLMEGFASIESAERFLRLLIGCYRFKRFTDSSNGRNGRAPLQLAGVDLEGKDWLSVLLSR